MELWLPPLPPLYAKISLLTLTPQLRKLDGVAPLIIDPPPTSFTTLFEKN